MEFTKYYYWEDIPSYGVRQMGKTDGYDTVEELMEAQFLPIAYNKSDGNKCWIAKAEVFEILSTEKVGQVNHS